MVGPDPPTYEEATSSASFSRCDRNGISPEVRRSMEDESRSLPLGWVRSFDPKTKHQFFVDTKADPPRSIWHHPYDDSEYLDSVSPEERERIRGLARHPSIHDITAETSDEEQDSNDNKSNHGHPAVARHGRNISSSSSSSASAHNAGPRSFGRKVKDKITGTTHEQREAQRRQREEQERDMHKQHQIFRKGLSAAIETGQPQYLGEDDHGLDVYLEPPGSTYSGVERVERISPYIQEIIYKPPGPLNKRARHLRPDPIYPGGYGPPCSAYDRPYGYGYGGGMGTMPLAGPLFGGLLLGGLAGGLLF
ncbi:hypothetical protein PFICI_08366 [Pestalotiopsis fici W106-1]|uniref:WW domain-containing protein n=1 Tax=Pestalotiopsis fici (strain W106-1 / CGMCC3.15140) TaxID=1229662 RepID=W3X630_PESFW|nr:uncharacterized protein PFICI_08366 [Pestalotiopsis fici W106-1]ETS80837.1 hypothetical protein PFICI_08366 [Pestalotiopsis fici W106-1]